MTTTCSLHVIVVAPGSSYLPVDLVVPSNRTLTEIVREVLGQRGLDSAGIEWTVWYDEHVLDASFSLARAIPDLYVENAVVLEVRLKSSPRTDVETVGISENVAEPEESAFGEASPRLPPLDEESGS